MYYRPKLYSFIELTEVDQESSTTMTPNDSEMGLSQPATFGKLSCKLLLAFKMFTL